MMRRGLDTTPDVSAAREKKLPVTDGPISEPLQNFLLFVFIDCGLVTQYINVELG